MRWRTQQARSWVPVRSAASCSRSARPAPRPGAWMQRLQRFLAIPMGASAVAAGWLLYRFGGERALLFALFASSALGLCLYFAGRIQRAGRPQARFAALLAVLVVVAAVAR